MTTQNENVEQINTETVQYTKSQQKSSNSLKRILKKATNSSKIGHIDMSKVKSKYLNDTQSTNLRRENIKLLYQRDQLFNKYVIIRIKQQELLKQKIDWSIEITNRKEQLTVCVVQVLQHSMK
ncbi:hypothetical protein SS50377_27600 [Spironucleus salmonicida]|uniref:Uncharacterized protein n=1 Tax=Spironucleus salmonicida TaxID=348837 RepID=V6LPK8_9EUKA|nr:hypothetical protein SS50377_27600 [Spironucleus salmonicida]|eukprot:EST46622.1 Hypothetical protein SS50377_13425 [Spironucleus salmonicida]